MLSFQPFPYKQFRMDKNYIFSPYRFPNKNKTIENRIALAPLTNLHSHEDGTLSDDEYVWLVSRAKGGFGMIITCAAHVSLDGQGWKGELGIYDNKLLEGLTRLAKGIKNENAVSIVQLFHGGARSPQSVTGTQPWSASAHIMPHAKEPVEIKEATEADIVRVINDFVNAAIRADKAGFDGIELHAAHGYLLHQFLSTATNKRTDEWGGSLANRAKILLDIIEKIKVNTSKDFLIGVRISPEDKYTFEGIDFDDSLNLAIMLEKQGIDFLHLSPWDALKKPEKYLKDEKPLVTYFKEALSHTPIIVAGGIWGKEDAEKALAIGADIVALGKVAIACADWPKRIVDERYVTPQPPYTSEYLKQQYLGASFIDYMKRWKGFVED